MIFPKGRRREEGREKQVTEVQDGGSEVYGGLAGNKKGDTFLQVPPHVN